MPSIFFAVIERKPNEDLATESCDMLQSGRTEGAIRFREEQPVIGQVETCRRAVVTLRVGRAPPVWLRDGASCVI